MKAVLRLGDLSVAEFMDRYWQRRPVLLKNVFRNWTDPVSPAALMELATLEDADARLIFRDGPDWRIEHGPFEPDDFDELPRDDWTVLVQEVDRLADPAADLLSAFRFLPNWRLDDLMISYATPGGGVGAHIDRYDVFLVQGSGSRRWEISETPVIDPEWRSDSEVAVLRHFEATQSWVLEPGDVLYLPPNIPHHGIALTPCMTYSVGFRAPGTTDLVSAVSGMLVEAGDSSDRYSDPGRTATTDPGLLDSDALEALRERIRNAMGEDDRLDSLIARALTEPTRGRFGAEPTVPESPSSVLARLRGGATLRATAASQVLWTERPYRLYAAGRSYSLQGTGASFGAALTGPMPVSIEDLEPLGQSACTVITDLVNDGAYRLA